MIRIHAVGKLKIGWAREACADYQRRLRRFGGVEIQEVDDGDPVSEAQALHRLRGSGPRVACDRQGENWTSPHLARWLGQHGSAVFLLGGPEGLAPDLMGSCDERLAFGAVTLPHELARVLLLEQIYRAMTILRGHPYHR
jgi:23S rRNA (pseudouridine1915-N3)-methyltransferase